MFLFRSEVGDLDNMDVGEAGCLECRQKGCRRWAQLFLCLQLQPCAHSVVVVHSRFIWWRWKVHMQRFAIKEEFSDWNVALHHFFPNNLGPAHFGRNDVSLYKKVIQCDICKNDHI